MAVRLPAARGAVSIETVRDVAEAAVTVPVTPLLKTTVLFAAVESKPRPSIVNAAALAAISLAALAVTTGEKEATWTAEPLTCPFEVTIAVTLPVVWGSLLNVTVSAVAEALVT